MEGPEQHLAPIFARRRQGDGFRLFSRSESRGRSRCACENSGIGLASRDHRSRFEIGCCKSRIRCKWMPVCDGRTLIVPTNDPEFAAKAADVVGLYIDPPAKAIVLCVDEKPSIQALERAQGYLKLPNGRALTGQSHDYKRHGTTTLFAALEVASGRIVAEHSKRRRRVEFLGFMNRVVAAFPDRELHVVLDNLNTHKKCDRWLKKHPNVHFHFTPTRSSWLNRIETWFSILQGQSLNGASFTSVEELQEHIDAFISAYNETATPFAWTKKRVYQRRFKNRRITQL